MGFSELLLHINLDAFVRSYGVFKIAFFRYKKPFLPPSDLELYLPAYNSKKKEFEILPTNLYDFDKVVLLISTTF